MNDYAAIALMAQMVQPIVADCSEEIKNGDLCAVNDGFASIYKKIKIPYAANRTAKARKVCNGKAIAFDGQNIYLIYKDPTGKLCKSDAVQLSYSPYLYDVVVLSSTLAVLVMSGATSATSVVRTIDIGVNKISLNETPAFTIASNCSGGCLAGARLSETRLVIAWSTSTNVQQAALINIAGNTPSILQTVTYRSSIIGLLDVANSHEKKAIIALNNPANNNLAEFYGCEDINNTLSITAPLTTTNVYSALQLDICDGLETGTGTCVITAGSGGNVAVLQVSQDTVAGNNQLVSMANMTNVTIGGVIGVAAHLRNSMFAGFAYRYYNEDSILVNYLHSLAIQAASGGGCSGGSGNSIKIKNPLTTNQKPLTCCSFDSSVGKSEVLALYVTNGDSSFINPYNGAFAQILAEDSMYSFKYADINAVSISQSSQSGKLAVISV